MGDSKKTMTADNTAAPAIAAAMMVVNPVAAKAWMDFMSESAQFVVDRLQQDLDTQKAMLECKSPDELIRIQTEFVIKAMAQYSEEATRMAKMISKATRDVIEDTKYGHSRGYDDVPL